MRNQEPPPWFFGPAFIMMGALGLVFGEPSPGIPPVLAYGITSLFVVAGVVLSLWSLGVKNAELWLGRIVGTVIAAAFTWLALLAPEEIQCTTTTYFIGHTESSMTTGCDTSPFIALAVILDLFVGYSLLTEFKRYRKRKAKQPT